MNFVKASKYVVPKRLWPYLGTMRRWLRTIPPKVEVQKKRLLRDPSLSKNERELLEKVSTRIYYNDGMYDGDAMHYFRVGLSAISCITEALEAAGLKRVRSILDLPCGSGRVLRFLSQQFPEAEITACELAPGPVEFCVSTFGARPAYSSLRLDEVSLAREFDLIWCGSLVTHLNESGIVSLLQLFRRHLARGGLLIFTTHGDYVPDRMAAREFDYGLMTGQIDRVGADYKRTGFGFEDYPGEKDYGVSLTSPEWIRARVEQISDLREVFFRERGWDNHQDVFGFVRE